MKRLLLSTTLILGTLSGVKGSAATLDNISNDVASVHTEVQSIPSSVTALQTSTQGDITALLTALHRLTPEVAATPLAPPAPAAIQTAYSNLMRASIVFDDNLVSQFRNSILSHAVSHEEISRLQHRITRATNTILEYFDTIISHKEWTKNQLTTVQNIIIFVACVV